MHCCYCGRGVHTLLHHATKEGKPHIYRTKFKQYTPLLYMTYNNKTICERCVCTRTVPVRNGGKPIYAFERKTGRYVGVEKLLKEVNLDTVDLEEETYSLFKFNS